MKTIKQEEDSFLRSIHLIDHSFVSQLIDKYRWSIHSNVSRSKMQYHKEAEQGAVHITEHSTRIEIKQFVQPLHIQLIYRSAELVALAQARVQGLSSLLQQKQDSMKMNSDAQMQYQVHTSGKRYISAPKQHQPAPFSTNYPLHYRLEQERIASWKLKASQQLLQQLSEKELVVDLSAMPHQEQMSPISDGSKVQEESKVIDGSKVQEGSKVSNGSKVQEGSKVSDGSTASNGSIEKATANEGKSASVEHQGKVPSLNVNSQSELSASGISTKSKAIIMSWSKTVQQSISLDSMQSSSLPASSGNSENELLSEEHSPAIRQAAFTGKTIVNRKKATLQPKSLTSMNSMITQRPMANTTISSKQLLRKLHAALSKGKQQLIIKQQHDQPLHLSYRVLIERNSLHERKVNRVHRNEAEAPLVARSLRRRMAEETMPQLDLVKQDQQQLQGQNIVRKNESAVQGPSAAMQNQLSVQSPNTAIQEQASVQTPNAALQEQGSVQSPNAALQEQPSTLQTNADKEAMPVQKTDHHVIANNFLMSTGNKQAQSIDEHGKGQAVIPAFIRISVEQISKLRIWNRTLSEQGERVVSLWTKVDKQSEAPTMNIRLVHRKLSELEQQATQHFTRQQIERHDYRKLARTVNKYKTVSHVGRQISTNNQEMRERAASEAATEVNSKAISKAAQSLYTIRRDDRLSYYFLSKRVVIERILEQFYAAKQRQDTLVYNSQPAKLKLAGINRDITVVNIVPDYYSTSTNLNVKHLILKQRLDVRSGDDQEMYSARLGRYSNRSTHLLKLYYRPSRMASSAKSSNLTRTRFMQTILSNISLLGSDQLTTLSRQMRNLPRDQAARQIQGIVRQEYSHLPTQAQNNNDRQEVVSRLQQGMRSVIETKIQATVHKRLGKIARLRHIQLTGSSERLAEIVLKHANPQNKLMLTASKAFGSRAVKIVSKVSVANAEHIMVKFDSTRSKQLAVKLRQLPAIMHSGQSTQLTQSMQLTQSTQLSQSIQQSPSIQSMQSMQLSPPIQSMQLIQQLPSIQPVATAFRSSLSSKSNNKHKNNNITQSAGITNNVQPTHVAGRDMGDLQYNSMLNLAGSMLTSKASNISKIIHRDYPSARLDVKKEVAPTAPVQGIKQLQQTVQRLEQQLQAQQIKLVKQNTPGNTRQLVDQLYDELSRKLRMEAKRFGR